MQVSTPPYTYSMFRLLSPEIQKENLELIEKVNKLHLHCDDHEVWIRVHFLITQMICSRINKKNKKIMSRLLDQAVVAKPVVKPDPTPAPTPEPKASSEKETSRKLLTQADYEELLTRVTGSLTEIFLDPLFTDPIREALQVHIMTPLCYNRELVELLCHWIAINSMYLPLGTHLFSSFIEDMEMTSTFAKNIMIYHQVKVIPEALSQLVLMHVKAFLSDVAQANYNSSYIPPSSNNKKTVVMLSCKFGAGGHTAPALAMEARLKERGWRVETINYDTDFPEESDSFLSLGLTFEDGTPMSSCDWMTRWKMQKQNKEVSRLVYFYIRARAIIDPRELHKADSGGILLRNKILPLNPSLIITTLAYHWCWQSLAYRIPTKIILVASDVFMHRVAMFSWCRQQSFQPKFRHLHFTTMTDDVDLLKGMATHHDNYYKEKFPNEKIHSCAPLYNDFKLDSQISVIGAPIHPAFDAITDTQEITSLKKKWGVPDGVMSICISRGRLGFNCDLIPALESYRTTKKLPYPLQLQVVCGENITFYDSLINGNYNDLGPNITVVARPLMNPRDFAELRAISTFDDIKAGGGSTFEGWYLISKGVASMLLLTPGTQLWWERSNCDAMEKWGIGRTIKKDTNKIAIVEEVMQKGLPTITHRFPDWKTPFDKLVDSLTR